MKRKFLSLVFIGLFLSPLIFASGHIVPASQGGDPGGNESWELNRAIEELSDPDQYVRRDAARKIADLTKVSGIQRAVSPIIDAIEDELDREGSYNRSIYLTTLGGVIRELGAQVNHSQIAIEFMAEALEMDNNDLVRVGAAHGLGVSKKESAIAPLEKAVELDPSALVQTAAKEALVLLKNELGIVDEQVSSMSADPSLTIDTERVEKNKLEKYVRDHFIIFSKDAE